MLSILLFLFPIQAVPTSKGQALADEYGIKFFETVSPILSDVEIESFFGCSKVQVTDK